MDAVINLDKPKGITSQEAVTRVKKLFKVKRAGHAGTLDPLATGVLLVCTGEGTKVTRFLADMEKEYVATMRLGQRTDTYDSEGKVIEEKPVPPLDEERVDEALKKFTGLLKQTPPMYSAIKVSGRPLYELARKGVIVERAEREVMVSALRLEAMDLPFLTLRVICSKGTYIRSLCDDLGRALGTLAHMTELRRVRVGRFTDRDSALPDDLASRPGSIHSIDSALGHLVEAVLGAADFRVASNGGAFAAAPYGEFPDGGYLRLKDPEGSLFAVGAAEEGKIKIERILHLGGKLKPIT